MSDHGQHGHGDGAVHVHVHSPKFYATILGVLLFLTVITVAASYVDIDGILALGAEVQGVGAWNLTLAVLIATAKATFVILFFMHLKDDSRFNALVFVGSVLFVGVFFAYTMNDTAVRGTMDRYNGVRVDPDTGLHAPGGIPDALRAQLMPTAHHDAAGAAEGAHDEAGGAPAEAAPTPAPAQPAGEAGEAAPEAAADEAAADEAAADEAAADEAGADEAAAGEAAAPEAAAPEAAAPEVGADEAGAGEAGAPEAGAEQGGAGATEAAAPAAEQPAPAPRPRRPRPPAPAAEAPAPAE
ncbi:MAG: cytochrome C oxidase subunit IV family protein [Sandaracinaceae bacterium]|nr:cytochrome C oxidase subunit IV family protein [Sandaracinaceae bacterium]